MPFLFLLGLLVLEVFIASILAGALGGLPVLLGALATSGAGFVLLRWVGRGGGNLFSALAAGADPLQAIESRLACLLGAILLLLPGFATDLAGLTLLVPATRPMWKRALQSGSRRAGAFGGSGFGWRFAEDRRSGSRKGSGMPPHQGAEARDKVIDADFEIID